MEDDLNELLCLSSFQNDIKLSSAIGLSFNLIHLFWQNHHTTTQNWVNYL